jgi:hypothetical protein
MASNIMKTKVPGAICSRIYKAAKATRDESTNLYTKSALLENELTKLKNTRDNSTTMQNRQTALKNSINTLRDKINTLSKSNESNKLLENVCTKEDCKTNCDTMKTSNEKQICNLIKSSDLKCTLPVKIGGSRSSYYYKYKKYKQKYLQLKKN